MRTGKRTRAATSAQGARARRPRGRAADTGARRYRVAPGVTHRDFAGQSIVLGPTGVLYTFAGSGRVVWPVIAGGASLVRAVEVLAARYGIARARARRDVLAFAHQLESRGIVRRQATRGTRPRA
jgi:coenzyme PQQ synthesis protein D (PqqD)